MGELDSRTRQKGARSCVQLEILNFSNVYSATILRKIDVETGPLANRGQQQHVGSTDNFAAGQSSA
jgi:hypothetical protein